MAGPEIKIEESQTGWVVRALGAIIGETKNALLLKEGDFPEVVYIPRKDITMAFLDKSGTTTTCPHKGKATYFSFVGKSRSLPDCAWSYETPTKNMAAIAEHLAFDPEQVAVERIS
jgi:uncharacterized protein (DUF427 family)